MKKLTKFITSVGIVFLALILFIAAHELVHIIQFRDAGIKDVCFLGYNNGAVGWVNTKNNSLYLNNISLYETPAYLIGFIIIFILLFLVWKEEK